MKHLILFISLTLSLLSSSPSRAGIPASPPGPLPKPFPIPYPTHHPHPDCPGGNCKPYTTCFNMVCDYKKEPKDRENEIEHDKGYKTCRAAAQFLKQVDYDGHEIFDKSEHPNNPEFNVQCDQSNVFNNSAHRFTDHLGTRLQAATGPYPAVVLPRNSLKEGRRYVESSLELQDQILKGYCYIYTGPAL